MLRDSHGVVAVAPWLAVGLLVTLAGCGPDTPLQSSSSSSESSSSSQEAGAPAEATASSSAADPGSSLHCDELPFVENVFWTTNYGPARADVRQGATAFLDCDSPSYALCYYSGQEPAPCKVDLERGIAECECFPYSGKNKILIHGILNTCAYVETVRDCGWDGAKCRDSNSAPACQYLNQSPQTLQPGADLVSTFSLEQPEGFRFGCTDCPSGVYAGCMTAPCYERTDASGKQVVVCECPLFEGPYQVGQDGVSCDAGPKLVWSAAYSPNGCAG